MNHSISSQPDNATPMFTIFSSDVTGHPGNHLYPHRTEIYDLHSLKSAVSRDYVCASYKNNHRSNENFLFADCLAFDCDNDHSNIPTSWVTPENVAKTFPNVSFAVHYSRSHMCKKNGQQARPKFHILFPIKTVTDASVYAKLKQKVRTLFPFFDPRALDAARFFFGTLDPQVEIVHGDMDLTEFLSLALSDDSSLDTDDFTQTIPAGRRNSTLSRYAAKILKRYGNTDKTIELFHKCSDRCDPPLDKRELDSIWRSALNFYNTKVVTQAGYVPPDEYTSTLLGFLMPEDYSDVGQAKIFTQVCGDKLIYTSATDFLRYDGSVWIEDKQYALGAAIEFLDRQLSDAQELLQSKEESLLELGISESAIRSGSKGIQKELCTPAQWTAYSNYLSAVAYQKFVMKRRDIKYISAIMNLSKSLLNRSINDTDKDPNLLNTPVGTFDLAKGISGMQPHNPTDLITKITACSPGDKGADIWAEALDTFFCSDADLIQYVKRVVGLAAIGKVYQEHLVIAYGDGANGKSTFWNTIARVLGTYSGKISAEVLTTGNKRNAKPEMAEMKGKRLIIASEMEEGMRLNTGMVKQLCSTDDIQAEKKFEKPFQYTPTHTLVLYTNHLPRIGANDDGIWRRLLVIPFNAKITGKTDIKNYADYLFANAGEAILKWILEGAAEAIRCDFKWPLPATVEKSISEYRDQNDWFSQYLDDQCEIGKGYKVQSGELYVNYRSYCMNNGEYARSSHDFYAALEKAGFKRKRTSSARLILGLKLRDELLS